MGYNKSAVTYYLLLTSESPHYIENVTLFTCAHNDALRRQIDTRHFRVALRSQSVGLVLNSTCV